MRARVSASQAWGSTALSDGMADIVGFGDYGVIVALSDGDSFEAPGYPDEFLF